MRHALVDVSSPEYKIEPLFSFFPYCTISTPERERECVCEREMTEILEIDQKIIIQRQHSRFSTPQVIIST